MADRNPRSDARRIGHRGDRRQVVQEGRATRSRVDEPLVELETDKVTLEVPAPAAGVLGRDRRQGRRDGRGRRAARPRSRRAPARRRQAAQPKRRRRAEAAGRGSRAAQPRRAAAAPAEPPTRRWRRRCARSPPRPASIPPSVAGTGKDGRVTKGDVLAAIERAAAAADAGRRSPRRRAGRARRRRPTTPRARSACDDAAAPDHRAAPEGGAEHRRHADDLQRGRHERGDGAAQPVQGHVREEARRQARLHGLLREGLRRRR